MIFSNVSGRSNNNLSNTSLIEELSLRERVNSLFYIAIKVGNYFKPTINAFAISAL